MDEQRARITKDGIRIYEDADFAGMNSVWDEWLPKGAQPARATVEAKLCEPEILVELSVVAALP